MKEKLKVVFSGGGTGGHIYPAVAIAKLIKKENSSAQVLFIGTKEGLESKIIPKEGFDIEYIRSFGFNRKLSFEIFKTAKEVFIGYKMAIKILKSFLPDVVVTTGGYVGVPVAFAAKKLNIPVIIHEQNAFCGLANKIIGRFATKILISFSQSRDYFRNKDKVILTGNPIREEIFYINQNEAKKKLNITNKTLILAIGGSLGAENLSKAVIDLAEKLSHLTEVLIVLSTGESKYIQILEYLRLKKDISNLKIMSYIHDMSLYLNAADIVISRGGAIALSEITALGKASIIVPSPYVTNNHQEYNARFIEKNNAAFVVLENELEKGILFEKIMKLLENKELLNEMSQNSKKLGRPNATRIIYNEIMKVIRPQ
ncbi:undecaprenyldiphospho-muramoylpentapeptide beta-N-acetylglucosaminyltransferase [Caldicellulosiruptoraceae bacterium PP1]